MRTARTFERVSGKVFGFWILSQTVGFKMGLRGSNVCFQPILAFWQALGFRTSRKVEGFKRRLPNVGFLKKTLALNKVFDPGGGFERQTSWFAP